MDEIPKSAGCEKLQLRFLQVALIGMSLTAVLLGVSHWTQRQDRNACSVQIQQLQRQADDLMQRVEALQSRLESANGDVLIKR